MYNIMKKLIEKKFYKTADDAQTKIDVFYAVSRINDDEYVELSELIKNTYNVTA